MELELEGCIKTLLVIERGDFPDEGCRGCDNLEKCRKLEPRVRRGLAAKKRSQMMGGGEIRWSAK